jgi:hypothetical protein
LEETDMNRKLLAAAAVALLGIASPSWASLVYNVVEYNDLDFSISGTITTDGTSDDFTSAPFNFQSWSITFTNPENNFTYSFDDSNSSWEGGFDTLGPLAVTPTEIFLNRPQDPNKPAQDLRLISNAGPGGYVLAWGTGQASPIFSVVFDDSVTIIQTARFQGSSETGLLIATAVPEPSTLALALPGLAIIGLGLSRRRRAA